MFAIRQARFADALELAGRLRFDDAREIASAWGVGARTGLFCCLLQSDRAFAVVDNVVDDVVDDPVDAPAPVALWGITDTTVAGLRVGIPWLLATDGLFRRQRSLALQSRRWVHDVLLEYDLLTNLTDARNTTHLRWLAWCGFVPLRVHERYGASGRRFDEFYLVNERRHQDGDALREVLLGRVPATAGSSLGVAVRRTAELGVAALQGAAGATTGPPAAIAALLQALDPSAGSLPPRSRSAGARLLLEIARRHRLDWSSRGEPLEEFCAALTTVADMAELAPAAQAMESLLGCLAGDARVASAIAGAGAAGCRPGESAAGRAFAELAHGYAAQLTDRGRWSCMHGYRLRAAALGINDQARHPLGVRLQTLDQELRGYYLTQALRGRGRLSMVELARPGQALLQQPLSHSRALEGLWQAIDRNSLLGQELDRMLDESALPAGSAHASGDRQGGIASFGDALAMVSAMADRLALRVLPSLRLGIVVSGYGDRHWLYRLLRIRLLLAASGCDYPALAVLLREDVTALLLAARFEDALLHPTAQGEVPVAALLGACLELFGAEIEVDDGLGYLTGLLLPVVSAPVVHTVQLAPALFFWHLAATGGLASAVRAVSEVPARDGVLSRPQFRRVLRRLVRDAGCVSLQRLLVAGLSDVNP